MPGWYFCSTAAVDPRPMPRVMGCGADSEAEEGAAEAPRPTKMMMMNCGGGGGVAAEQGVGVGGLDLVVAGWSVPVGGKMRGREVRGTVDRGRLLAVDRRL